MTEPEIDTWSSASRQHYIDTGEYLRVGEAWTATDTITPKEK